MRIHVAVKEGFPKPADRYDTAWDRIVEAGETNDVMKNTLQGVEEDNSKKSQMLDYVSVRSVNL
jgi:hypothetical protein